MSILATLTPAESKRLIGRALCEHPLVKRAMKQGRILISNGTTTGYFVEELLQEKMDIARFACGVVTGGVQCMSPGDRIRSVYVRDGKRSKMMRTSTSTRSSRPGWTRWGPETSM